MNLKNIIKKCNRQQHCKKYQTVSFRQATSDFFRATLLYAKRNVTTRVYQNNGACPHSKKLLEIIKHIQASVEN